MASICLLWAGQASCQSAASLLAYFHTCPVSDTLHFETSEEGCSPDTIPNSIFFAAVPAAFLKEIDYLADSAGATVLACQSFALGDSTLAMRVDIRQFWFQHQSLLLYNTRQQTITARITVAEWYGGEGGQVLTGAWMFDYNHDGFPDLVIREIQHSTQIEGDEAVEYLYPTARLLLWNNGQFAEKAGLDMDKLVRQFPIRSDW